MPIQPIQDSRDNIISTIRKVAHTQNADFKYLLNQAKVESGLNPQAKASTSSATGLFQFTAATWMNMVKRHGDKVGLASEAQSLRANMASGDERREILSLRNEPYVATALAAHLAADNAQALSAAGHKSIGPTELYMAHFLGASGANTFLNGLRDKPSEPAANALPLAAAANKSVFYANRTPLSYQDIYNRFAQKFVDAASSIASNAPSLKETAAAAVENIGAFEARVKQAVASAIAASRAPPVVNSAEASAAPAVSETAMMQYLKNFTLVDHASGMSQVSDAHARDASQAAEAPGSHEPIGEHGVSPLASGARLILKAADPRQEN